MRYITINNIKYEVFSDSVNDQFYIIQNGKKQPICQVFPYNAKREKEMQKLNNFRNFVNENFVDRTRLSRIRQNPYPRSPPRS
ncbi:uncharacterized protein LOC136075447 isoform X2 [Hydra vulgaris]|uniref:Uncharacterized protein LOC136075447 isoform X2 n=1 Tax=Hydra vulgaris TaxID=6087 RepID=A0ABM4B7B3_HYDVU